MKTSESVGFLSPETSRLLVPAFIKRIDMFVGDRILRNWSFQNPGDEENTKRVQRYYTNAEGERVGMSDPQLAEAEPFMGAVARHLTTLYTSHFTEDQLSKPTREMTDLVLEALGDGRGEGKRLLVDKWNKGKDLPSDPKKVAIDLYEKQILREANAAARKTGKYTYKKYGAGQAGREAHAEAEKETEKRATEALEWLRLRGFDDDDIYWATSKRNRSELLKRLSR